MPHGPSGSSRSQYATLGLLFVLYVIQGLPFGFQARALPAFLREAGESLTIITLSTLLSLPWALKVLWSPWVDRDTGSRLGYRRKWILPMQAILALACVVAAFVPPDDNLAGLLVVIFAMNLCTATMDIAVDGLAVDVLEPKQLGYGNIAQVVGYKVGMVVSGGLLLAFSDDIGWTGMFGVMGGMVAIGFAAMLAVREPVAADRKHPPPKTVRRVLAVVRNVLWTRSSRALLALIITYKMGESMADVLFVPFLIDNDISKADIGIWLGTYGMVASIAGSTVGGIASARMSFTRAVAVFAALRVLPLLGQWWLTTTTPTAEAVIAITMAESFFGGALTTAMFALMMSCVDRKIGATHYTALATVEVLGKGLSTVVAGPIADATDYTLVYGVATVLSLAFLGLLAILVHRLSGSADDSISARVSM